MSYTVAYRTSVGALTVSAHDEDEALEKVEALRREGFSRIDVIDESGCRQEARSFEQSLARSRPLPRELTVH